MMSQAPKNLRPPNKLSRILLNSENQCLLETLGDQQVTLATGVVQMLAMLNGRWSKISDGVLCFIKDYRNQIYSFRLLNLNSKKIIFQQRVRSEIRLEKSIERFYTFDIEEKKFGIYFTDAGEGAIFCKDFNEKQEQRSKKAKLPAQPNSKGTDSSFNFPQVIRNIRGPYQDIAKPSLKQFPPVQNQNATQHCEPLTSVGTSEIPDPIRPPPPPPIQKQKVNPIPVPPRLPTRIEQQRTEGRVPVPPPFPQEQQRIEGRVPVPPPFPQEQQRTEGRVPVPPPLPNDLTASLTANSQILRIPLPLMNDTRSDNKTLVNSEPLLKQQPDDLMEQIRKFNPKESLKQVPKSPSTLAQQNAPLTMHESIQEIIRQKMKERRETIQPDENAQAATDDFDSDFD